MNYQVGQILYICNEKKLNIYPVQIVEEIIRTTLNGKEKAYVIMLPDKEKTCIEITKVKDNLYESLESVKTHMITNATSAIENMANSAEILGKKAFGKVDQKEEHVQVETNNDIIMVDLGNGTKAKMNSSSLEKVINQ